jgi:outer membrane protein assembly factor BamB
MPVFVKDRIYVAAGGDPWHGKESGGLYCIDAAGSGEISRSGRVWQYLDLGQSASTPSIGKDILFVAGYDGRVHCLDPDSGKPYWVHDTIGRFYGSTLLADGKLYAGNTRGELWIFKASKRKQIFSRVRFDSPVHSTPAAAGGILYIATGRTLYAIKK